MKQPRLSYNRAHDYYLKGYVLSREVDELSERMMMQEADLRARVALEAHRCRCERCMGKDGVYDPMGKTWARWCARFERMTELSDCLACGEMVHRTNVLNRLGSM